MSDVPKQQSSPKKESRGGRQARLAAALRANLARRKAQGRGRAAPSSTDTTKPPERG
jgi:hypothetical protein